MKLRDMTGWILLLAALLVGGATFYLIRDYLAGQEQRIRLGLMAQEGDTQRVVVAKRDLPIGAVISPATMAIGEMPVEHVSSRAIRVAEFEQLEGHVLERPMSAGEPLLADFVAGLIIERFSDLVAKGERAVSLEVSALETHAGMLVPGDTVDLFVMLNAGRAAAGERLVPVIERVEVLAAGRQPLRSAEQDFQPLPADERFQQITVSVPLADAKRLVAARERGEIVYLLRSPDDKARVAGRDELFGLQPPPDSYWLIAPGLGQGQRRYIAGPEAGPAGAERTARSPATGTNRRAPVPREQR